MGGGVGRWPMEGGQGGRWGGHQRAVWFPLLGFFKTNNWSDLAGDEGGGMGGGVGRWPMEGKGGDGGGGAAKNWSDLAGDEGGMGGGLGIQSPYLIPI